MLAIRYIFKEKGNKENQMGHTKKNIKQKELVMLINTLNNAGRLESLRIWLIKESNTIRREAWSSG